MFALPLTAPSPTPKSSLAGGMWGSHTVCFMGSGDQRRSGEGGSGTEGLQKLVILGPRAPPTTRAAQHLAHLEAQASLGSRPMSRITLPCTGRSHTPWSSES